jgi:hypothetical protein
MINECCRCFYFSPIEKMSLITGRCCHPDYDRPVVYGSNSLSCFVPLDQRKWETADITDELSPEERSQIPDGMRAYTRRELK